MKKNLLKAMLIVALTAMAGNANAQLSNILGDVASKVQAATNGGDGGVLSTITLSLIHI